MRLSTKGTKGVSNRTKMQGHRVLHLVQFGRHGVEALKYWRELFNRVTNEDYDLILL